MSTDSQINTTQTFSQSLIDWYDLNKRDLPWRNTTDPYIIWLSEIILQQTRVQQGLPYFNKFLEAYPDVESFACSSEQEILKLWQGLGYYSRARNMLACARDIVEKFDGKFPDNYRDLQKLKGIGKYTAAAIASFAYKEPVPVLDGNVFRVLSRVFGLESDIGEPKSYKLFFDKAKTLVSLDSPDQFNQAIMEFGALHCTPKAPHCDECIFISECFAYRHGLQADLPVKKKKIKKRTRHFNYFVIHWEDKVLLNKRQGSDIWQGMYEFLLFESGEEKDFDGLIRNEAKFLFNQGNLITCSSNFKHVLTHQTIFAKFFLFSIINRNSFEVIKENFELEEIKIDDLHSKPVSRLIDKYLEKEVNYLS